MNSSTDQKIEMLLGKMDPLETMQGFAPVWEKFQKAGGMPKPGSSFRWDMIFKLVPVPAIAVLIALAVFFNPFSKSMKTFEKEGEFRNETAKYIKVNWRGHTIAVSPGSHWKLLYPEAANRSVVVYLFSGKILCHPKKLNGDEKFVVVLPDAEASVKGTIFSVKVDGKSRKVTVAEGTVWVKLNGKPSTKVITAGQTMEWKSSGIEPVRKTDGEDLSDIIREIGMDRDMVKSWSLRMNGDLGSLTAADGRTWVISGPDLWKLEGKSGAQVVYRQPEGRTFSHIALSAEKVVLASSDGGLWVVRQDGSDVKEINNVPSFRPYASPVFSGKFVAYPTLDANIWYYDISTGRQNTIVAPEGDTVFSAPLIENDTLYFLTGSGRLIVYDMAADKIKSSSSVFSERLVFPVVKSGNYLLIFDRKNGKIAYLNRNSGKTEAVVQGREIAGIDQYPSVMDENSYWYDPNDRSGRIFKSAISNHQAVFGLFAETGSPVNGLSIRQDQIFVSSTDGELAVIEKSGKPLWKRSAMGKIVGVDQDGFYIKIGSLVEYFCTDAL
jgi:hypothetical protein